MKRSWLGALGCAVLAGVALVATPAVGAAQNAVISGTVRSDGGEPVAGANVFIVELNLQVATSEAGRYTLTVPGDRVRGQQLQLRVRAISYRPSSRAVTIVAGQQTMDFTLLADVNRLDEIVVTGVLEGTEQGKVPFSVARVDLADVPVQATDPLRLLAGRVPGANITSASGRPGSSPAVLLRGPTSINASGRGQGPLYIVDGVIINGSLPDLNPADIENVEVVKGAAASSLYGARAGNGVIQITTRSGRRAADGTTFNVRSEVGTSDIERDFHLARNHAFIMDARNERFCRNTSSTGGMCGNTLDWNAEAARINNDPGFSALSPLSLMLDPGPGSSGAALRNSYQARRWPGRIYNAVQQTVDPALFQNTTADATGRFGQTQFFASMSAANNGGAIRYLEGYERYSGRLNVDQRVGTAWSFAFRSYFSRSTEDGLNQEDGGTAFFRLTRVPAIVNVLQRDTLGRLYIRTNILGSGAQNENPLSSLADIQDEGISERFIGGVTGRYTPTNWLDVEANFSYDYGTFTRNQFIEKGRRVTTASRVSGGSIGSVFSSESNGASLNSSLNVTLRRNLTRDLASRWSFRYLYEQQDSDARSASGNTLAAFGVPDLNNATANQSVGSSETSVRQVGLFAGVNLEYKDRYVVDALIRRDGSSLFGDAARWKTFGRASLAWRVSRESWWFAPNSISDFKLRASRGSAGGRPAFSAQYETFAVGSAGITFGTAGNRNLRPEITVDNEVGVDMELWRRIGVNLTYAASETRDQILLVPAAAEKGFSQQWQNAGTLQNRTWELAVNVPIIQRRELQWAARFIYDRTRTTVTELNVPPFFHGGVTQATGAIFQVSEGERYGTFYGRRFLTSCDQLPPAFQAQCGGSGSQFQFNNEGWLVWTGGFSPGEGITRNLYTTQLPSASAPWGVATNWGMPILLRDTSCIAAPNASCPSANVALGNALPSYTFSIQQNVNWRRLSVYALFQAVMGRDVWNQGRHWSYLDFLAGEIDQEGVSVENAKPIGYYFRSAPPDHPNGIGGFYEALRPNNRTTESASYGKLRELALSYNVGALGGVGNWTVSLIGRNLFTISNYHGFDPEVGQSGGTASSSAINAIDAFTFPNTRTFTFALSTSF